MPHSSRTNRGRLNLAGLAIAAAIAAPLASACAPAISASASDIPRLEQARATSPKSEPVQRSLGIAYFKANRFADARASLEQAAKVAVQEDTLRQTSEQTERRAVSNAVCHDCHATLLAELVPVPEALKWSGDLLVLE